MRSIREKRLKITVSEEQAEDIKRALDFYCRFLAGQYEVLADDFDDLLDKESPDGRKPAEIAVVLKQIRDIILPGLSPLGLLGCYSVGSTECNPHAGIAYDLCQEFWYRRAWFLHPEGGTTVDFNTPRHMDNDPCPAPYVSYSFGREDKVQTEISACETQFLVIISALTAYSSLLRHQYRDLFRRFSNNPEAVALAGKLEDLYRKKREAVPQGKRDFREQTAKQFMDTADFIGKELERK